MYSLILLWGILNVILVNQEFLLTSYYLHKVKLSESHQWLKNKTWNEWINIEYNAYVGAQKVRSLKISNFWQPLLACWYLFVLHATTPLPPSSMYVCFIELPPPLSKKVIFRMKNGRVRRKKRLNFVCKLNINYFFHSYIYIDNKNNYKFIRKR